MEGGVIQLVVDDGESISSRATKAGCSEAAAAPLDVMTRKHETVSTAGEGQEEGVDVTSRPSYSMPTMEEEAVAPTVTAEQHHEPLSSSSSSSSSEHAPADVVIKLDMLRDTLPPVPPKLQRRTSSSEVVPVRVDLRKLCYTVRTGSRTIKGYGGKKDVLQDVTLTFPPGQLVAIMGPSGCGKTSLLRAIHGNPKHLKHVSSGDVYVNNTPVRKIHAQFRRVCCLVPQEDVLLPTFTVWDTILYAAHLRLVSSCREEKVAVAQRVLNELGLWECHDVAIKMISGGQKRRVSIALELLVDPSILLLDEPTSGLDSKTTEDLCHLLASLAGPSKAVLATIHQPSYKVFLGFHRIVFMTQGRVVYDGPAVKVRAFFESLGLETPCFENPADFYTRTIQEEPTKVLEGWRVYAEKQAADAAGVSGGHHHVGTSHTGSISSSSSCSSSSGSLSDDGHHDEEEERAMGAVKWMRRTTSSATSSMFWREDDAKKMWLEGHRITSNHVLWEFAVLFARMMQDAFQDPIKLLSGLIVEAAVGALVGLGWYQLPMDENKSIFPVLGVMIMLTTLGVMDSCLAICVRFPSIRALHFREFANGYYRLGAYYAASLATGCLLCSLYQVIQGLIVYFMVGFSTDPVKVCIFLLIVILSACTGSAIGFLIGVVTSEVKVMQHYLTPVLMPMMLYAGYMLPYQLIPQYLKPVYYVSIYQYVYSAFIMNHFKGLVFTDCPPGLSGSGVLCAHTGEQVLQHSSLDAHDLPRTIACIVAFFAFTCALGFLVLRCKSH